METVRIVCAHDCPDMCSLLAEVEDGRVLRIKGDPEQPFTAGFACAKVNRDAELVHSPERLQAPLRRTGAKGEGKFAPIRWDEALDEIVARRSRTARLADWHLQINIGTDAALALGVMHILTRDERVDREYVAAHTLGFDRLEAAVLPRFTPERVAAITGLAVADIERFAALYGGAERSFIRIGEGMTRLARGGEALRAVALLPGVTGAYGRRGGGALLLTAASCELNYNALRKPSGPETTRLVNHLRLGDALLTMTDPPLRALFIAANNPAVTCPDAGKVRRGLLRDDLFTVVHDPFLSVTAR